MTSTHSMELMKRKRVKCLKCYKYGYFTQIRPLAAAVSCHQHLSIIYDHHLRSSRMSLLPHLGASAADFTPYVPFAWRNSSNRRPPSSTISTAGAPAGAAAATAITYPSPPSMPQPLSRNQRRRRNKASRNSTTPQPPPPPQPAPIYQPAAFPDDYMPGYLETWMNTYNPAFTHAPPPRRRAVSNNFNYDGDIERWLRKRGWGWTAPLA